MGLDLIDFFRGRHSWRKLRNLLERLPVSSAYREAMLDDPEVAELLAAQPESDAPARPRLSEFDQTTALLTSIYDRLGTVIEAVVASSGNKPPTIHPSPRPVTGVTRARERVAQQRHLALVDEVKAAQERWRRNREERSK